MQPDQPVEVVLEDHQHVDAAEQLAQHDALVHALAPVQPVARVGDLLPVLEGGALVVAPELRPSVELREVDQRLPEAAGLPIRRPAREVLRHLETKGRGQLLLLDGGDVEVGGRLDPSLGQLDEVVDRLQRPATEHPAGQELRRRDRRGEFLEQRRSVRPEPKQDVGHEQRHQAGQARPEIRVHLFEVAIALP